MGGAGDDLINGGSGFDVAKFTGNASDYDYLFETITHPDTGEQRKVLQIIDRVEDRDGVDTMVNVERLQFADVTYAITPDFKLVKE